MKDSDYTTPSLIFGVSVIPLAAIGITCLVFGLQYHDVCRNSGAYFLELEGGLFLGWCIHNVLCTFACKTWMHATICALCLGPFSLIPAVIGLISEISILIWGSVVIFGKSHAGAKIHNLLSRNSHIENSNFYKNHIFEISIFIKFTFLKYYNQANFWIKEGYLSQRIWSIMICQF